MKYLLCCLILCLLSFSACNNERPTAPKRVDLADSAYIAFAQKLEAKMQAGKEISLNKALHPGLFIQELGEVTDEQYQTLENFVREFQLQKRIAQQMEKGYAYNFIRFYRKSGQPHAIFRLYDSEGFNYHDYKLAAIEGEGIFIQDCYFYLSGEWLSESAKRMIVGSEQLSDTDLALLADVRTAMDKGDYPTAHGLFLKISPEGRDTKFAQLTYINLVSGLGDSKLFKARLEYYEKSFPEDPSLYLISYVAYMMRKDYNGAIAQLEALRKNVGQDPVLDLEEAFLYLSQDRPDAAKLLLKDAEKKGLRSIEDYHFAWLDVAVQSQDDAQLLETLQTLQKQFNYDKESLRFILKDAYPDYVPSAEVKEWLES